MDNELLVLHRFCVPAGLPILQSFLVVLDGKSPRCRRCRILRPSGMVSVRLAPRRQQPVAELAAIERVHPGLLNRPKLCNGRAALLITVMSRSSAGLRGGRMVAIYLRPRTGIFGRGHVLQRSVAPPSD